MRMKRHHWKSLALCLPGIGCIYAGLPWPSLIPILFPIGAVMVGLGLGTLLASWGR